MNTPDIFIIAAEPSADLYGSQLILELKTLRPELKISAVAGPRMRQLAIEALFRMEDLQVMGFLDVIAALPKLICQFFRIRNRILRLPPRAVICIDYPGFNLRLERSLRNKGFKGKLIHYVCPTVWAWGKGRIPRMVETLDLLLTLFPFEKECFSSTKLSVQYIGHPLISQIPQTIKTDEPVLAVFPGSRETEIRRNFSLQLRVAQMLSKRDERLKIAVSIAHTDHEPLLHSLAKGVPITFYPHQKNNELMQIARVAIATSGTVTLELALHEVPTVVNFAIRPLDLFLAQKIFQIHLPYYCIVNIILMESIFPELFGPNLTEKQLFYWAQSFWTDEEARKSIKNGCLRLRKALGNQAASCEVAKSIIALAF